MTASGEYQPIALPPRVPGIDRNCMLIAATMTNETLAGQIMLPHRGRFANEQERESAVGAVADLMDTEAGEMRRFATEQQKANKLTFALRMLTREGYTAELTPMEKSDPGAKINGQ